jgi:hypothetical protein
MIRISQPTLSGTVLFESCVVLFSLGCNPRFGEPSGTESAVSGALAVLQKRIEQVQMDRLFREAAAFQQAGEIRRYVEAIRLAQQWSGFVPPALQPHWTSA